MHGMLHHRTAHKLQLLLMVVLVVLMMLLQRMLMQWMRMLLLRHLLRPSEGISPRTLWCIRLEALVFNSTAAGHSGWTIATRCRARLQVTCLGAEAAQDAGAQSRWIL